jgi:hypothetical protein
MRVLAFTRYNRDAASTRHRLLQFLPALEEAGMKVEWHPLLGDGHMLRLVAGRRGPGRNVLAAYARRIATLARAVKPDLLWVYGELFPYLPAALERAVMPRGVPVIYDWDDAFHLAYQEHSKIAVRSLLGPTRDRLDRLAIDLGQRTPPARAARAHPPRHGDPRPRDRGRGGRRS